ncbi:flagellar basal-body rod protein FlgF [Legionella sp. km772]|uniref:flagellar basal-body rod protein FlgF n=1 Tax=Legionella sp. km772 TaxID=2498111 RepID=UPI000F8DAE04|nr:flagellar basal-body rod protein FlgF [Legionella sp. km772]RUR08868.1 flagellar basal-body rod protein FlgF [Legionella sp. km772]
MDPVLYSAVDGGTNDLVRQDIIANNLANINTPGFKADLYQAQVMYLTDQNGQVTSNSPSYIVELPSTIDTSPGELMTTGRPLDFAVSGNGYIAIQGATGEVYTRGGSFHIDAEGQLLTASGNPVLGDGGPISIPPARSISVGSDGTISVVPLEGTSNTVAVVDRIKTVTVAGAQLSRTPDGFLSLAGGAAAEADPTVQVVGGALEGSNVNAVDQMVQMISASRDFDAQMKIMATVETDADKLAQVLQQ